MQVFANFLINPSQATIGMIVTSDMPFLALHKVLMSLYRKHEENNKERIKSFYEFLNHIKRLADQRNNLIHSAWYVGLNDQTFQKVNISAKFKKGLKIHKDIVRVSEIEALSQELFSAAMRLIKIYLLTQKEFYEKNSPKTKV